MRRTRGQSTIEYVLLIAVIIVAMLAVQIYCKRAVEGRMKQSADQIGEQWSTADSDYTIDVSTTGARQEKLETSGKTTSTITTDEVQSRDAKSYKVGGDVKGKLF